MPNTQNNQASGRFALITGASSGIGLELARRFAEDGMSLILVARSTKKLEKLAKDLEQQFKVRAHVISADLAEPYSVNAIFQECKSLGFEVECLVNNAGFGSYGPFLETSWDVTQKMIELNVSSLVHLTHLFAVGMRERRAGRILNVASTAAFQPGPLMAVYYATKAFVLSFSEALGEELRGTGVTVTALCPGATESGFQAAAKMENVRLVSGRHLPTSREVAEYGYDAMMKGKPVAIHGVLNFLMAQSVRFTPRALVTKIVKTIQSEKT